MHAEAQEWFRGELALFQPRHRVLEIGSRSMNLPPIALKDLFLNEIRYGRLTYLGIDVAEGKGVDVIASGTDYQPPWKPDTVLCAEVLEHVPDDVAAAICRNAYDVLEPGGLLLMSMAADPRAPHSAVDGGLLQTDEFYRNVTPELLRGWLNGFGRAVWSLHERGDLYVRAHKRLA